MNGRARKYRFLPFVALSVLVLLLGGGMLWVVRHFLSSAPPAQKKVVQEIHVIRPPPPPPDLPPPPPPPPEEAVKLDEPQPDPTPSNEPPPGEQLGLDAEGGVGDGFGLVGRPGGRDLLASGGSAYAWYAGLLKNEILERLQDDQSARKGSYTVLVRVWVKRDGMVERFALVQSSGDRDRDRAIEQALSRINRIAQAPPADMPQPVSLRIVSRA